MKRIGIAALLCIVSTIPTLHAQNPEALGLLKGVYFVREVAFSNLDATSGQPAHTRAITGLMTLDGNGNYTFTGTLLYNVNGATAQPYTHTGGYFVTTSGLLQIDSLINTSDSEFGGVSSVGPNAFVASATEGPFYDMLVGIPVSPNFSLASLTGSYRGGYQNFANGTVAKTRNAIFTLSPDGQGGLAPVSVSGSGSDLGAKLLSQSIAGATYLADPATNLGAINFGTADDTQLLSGSKVFGLSADGNLIIGGDPNGYDLFVAVHPFHGDPAAGADSGSNAASKGSYFLSELDNDTSGLPTGTVLSSFYGSSSGQSGQRITYLRWDESDLASVYDYTYSSAVQLDATGSAFFGDGAGEFLGADGQSVIGIGGGQYYMLFLELKAVQTPVGANTVFIDPLSVTNSASLAPITNPIAAGEFITISGVGLAPTTVAPPADPLTGPLPTNVNGVQVTLLGTKAPIYSVSPTQITFIAPRVATDYAGLIPMQVTNNGVTSNTVYAWGSTVAPAIWSTNTGTNPVKPGDSITIYCTGLGPVKPALADGVPAPTTPPSATVFTAKVYVDGIEAKVTSTTLVPGTASRYQIQATVPGKITPGANVYLDVALYDPDGYPWAYTSIVQIPTAN